MQLNLNEREILDSKILRIDNYEGYDFSEQAGYIMYSILKYYEVQGYDQDGKWILRINDNPNYFIVKPEEYSGKLPLTFELVNQWGADDQLIFQYAADQLGLTLI